MLTRLIAKYLKPYWYYVLAVLVLQAIAVVMNLYLPRLNGEIIDDGIAKGDTDFIWSRGLLMLGVAAVQMAVALAAVYCTARAAMKLGRDLRTDIYKKVASFSEKEVRAFGPGSLITRNTNDVQQVQLLTMQSGTLLVMAPLMAIGGTFMALQQDVKLSSVLAVAIPVMLVVASLFVWRMIPKFRAYQEKLDSVNRILREQLTGIRVIRAFVREPIEEKRFGQANYDIMKIGWQTGSLFVLLFPSIMLILDLTIVAVLWFGSQRVDLGDLELGVVMAFMQYVMQILFGVLMATFMMIMIPRAAVCAERIQEVLSSESAIKPAANPRRDWVSPGTLQFEDVSFQFADAEAAVLKDVSFRVEAGQTVAVIGSTASGKSTLVSLVPRLFDVTEGSVRVGGVDVRELDQEFLWSAIGLVPQKAFLFSGTVESNLRLAAPEATEGEMWAALETAQAADFVREMDGGLKAHIAQGGTNVSGGQRQRLAIARALVRRPQLLIFDDSFSALDLTTDAKLRQALWRDFPGTTKIVVAQRVSTIRDADLILVMDNGRIVGAGQHQELAETCDTYKEIIESQLAAEAV